MTADRREWDLIVVGLGGLGSGAAYWARPARRARPRARAVRARSRQRRVRRPLPDHPAVLPPARLRPARQARLRVLGRGRGRVRRPDRDGTGGLDLWPAGAAIPMADYTDSLTAEGVPFERLDADEMMRRWPQWRLDEDITAIFQAQAGSPTRTRATPPTSGWPGPRRHPPRPDAGHGAARRRRRGRAASPAGVTLPGRPAGRRRRTPGPTSCSRRSVGGCRSTITRSRSPTSPARDPSASRRTASRSGSGWTTRASTASRPTARPGRRPPRTAAASRRRRPSGRSSATPAPTPACARSWRATCRPRVGPQIYTKTCLYTLHARPRLRRRPPARRSPASLVAAGGGARLQVRLGHRPDPRRAGARRWHAIGAGARAIPASTGRSCSRSARRRRWMV